MNAHCLTVVVWLSGSMSFYPKVGRENRSSPVHTCLVMIFSRALVRVSVHVGRLPTRF
jgi:hypothetical protein